MILSAPMYHDPKGASIYFSLIIDGKKIQKSTKRSKRKEATQYVRDVLTKIAEDRLLGRTGPVTLGEVFTVYFKIKVPAFKPAWKKAAEARRGLFVSAWGRGKHVRDLGQADIDKYAEKRRNGALTPEGSSVRGVKDSTIEAEVRWLSTCFRWARGYKIDGRGLVDANPLEGLRRPRPTNVRRPVASHERYLKTLERVNEVDGAGRLHAMLVLARHTGHRQDAIGQLSTSDYLRTKDEVGAALAALGLDERQAEHFPFGGIRWRAETDKTDRSHVAPISQLVKEEIEAYLRKNPRVGETPLFPSPGDPLKPVSRHRAAAWLMRAERKARLPKLAGGRWHPYRRLWATERRHLPAQDVAAAGGWSDVGTLTTIYQHAEAEKILEVVQASQ